VSESYLCIGGDYVFVRHSEIRPGLPTVLFVHGLGDSGLAFREAFDDRRFDRVNVIVPDLIGYGRSSASRTGDYSFSFQTEMLWKVIDAFRAGDLTVVGHSMGGDITTLLCASDEKGLIKKYVNVEGDVTELDLFLSGRVVKAADEGDFEEWFDEEFLNTLVYERWGKKLRSVRRYYASLQFCRPEAFLANSRELVRRNTTSSGRFKSEMGMMYYSLAIPKVFCYGTRSLPKGVIEFLKENNLPSRVFEDAAHMLMIERPDEFYAFLYDFIHGDSSPG